MHTGPTGGINCKHRWSFYYFRRGLPSAMWAKSIRSFVHSFGTGCSRIADKHLVYLTHRIILVIFRPPRCSPVVRLHTEGKYTEFILLKSRGANSRTGNETGPRDAFRDHCDNTRDVRCPRRSTEHRRNSAR